MTDNNTFDQAQTNSLLFTSIRFLANYPSYEKHLNRNIVDNWILFISSIDITI